MRVYNRAMSGGRWTSVEDYLRAPTVIAYTRLEGTFGHYVWLSGHGLADWTVGGVWMYYQDRGDALLQHLQVNEMTVAVDTTGFRNDTARAYYQSRRGGTQRSWRRVCGGHGKPADCGDAGGAGSDAPW